ncbi:MAG: PIG-L family deacetylase, partial [Hungatella sp.]
ESSDFSVGRSRLRETLASLEVLGVDKNQVEFLGYADTGMPKEDSFLYQLYQEKDGSRVKESSCSDKTYGLEEKEEFHKKKYGAHAPYDRNHVEEDLKQVILQYRPNRIFTTSEYDVHGDHSGLYLFVRDVLKQIQAEGGLAITLYSGIVHSMAGDDAWPLRKEDVLPYSCPTGFEESSSLKWENRIRFEVPACMKEKDKSKNLKYQALSKHVTALKPDAVDFLYSFIKDEELFWKMEENRKSVYPVEPWCVTEESFSMDTNYRNETTFSLSNGYLGTRGTMEEGYDFSVEEGLEGNFINGFYEQEDIRYGEWNYGFPTTSQSLMNLPNGKTIKLFLDEEELDIRNGKVEDYHRTLHMDEGILTRSFLWTSQKGKTVRIETSRFVSFAKKNLMEMSYKATPVNFDGHLLFVSILDANVENHTRKTNPLVDYGPFGRHLEVRKLRAEEDILYYEGIAQNSRLSIMWMEARRCTCTVSYVKMNFSVRCA